MKYVKVQYVRDGVAKGKEYAFKTELDLPIGLELYAKSFGGHKKVKITNVIESEETQEFKDLESELKEAGYTPDGLVEIDGQDLVVTAVKSQEL